MIPAPNKFRQAFRLDEIEGRYDRVVFGSAAALAALGVIMVASSSMAVAEGLDVGALHFLFRHLVFLGAGLLLGASAHAQHAGHDSSATKAFLVEGLRVDPSDAVVGVAAVVSRVA